MVAEQAAGGRNRGHMMTLGIFKKICEHGPEIGRILAVLTGSGDEKALPNASPVMACFILILPVFFLVLQMIFNLP